MSIKTLTFSIKLNIEDSKEIKNLQTNYSIAFRKCFNNMELIDDFNFKKTLPIQSKKQLEYLKKEVIAFHERNIANKKRINNNINNILTKRTIKPKDFKNLIALKKSLKSNVCFGDKKELIKLSKGIGDKQKWKESRLLALVYYGETSRNGNRFFDLSKLDQGIIIFKPEKTKLKLEININTNKYKELRILRDLAINKSIPITIKLSYNKIYLTYDVSILNKTNLDIKKFYNEINNIKDKNQRKKLISNKHREHELYLKQGKLDRYIGLDLNPDGIGYSIVDNNMNIINKGYFDLSKIIKNKKRKYETSIIIKRIFSLIKHFKAHTIVLEELNIENKDNGNRISNRKINNLWNRTYIKELIERRCAETGTLKICINPVYSSFIGNIIHNEYDPIAASLEVVRRGINKYSKGGFYPEFNITNFINDKRYDEIRECKTWKDMYSLFITSKWSYRRRLNNFNFIGRNISSIKSCSFWLQFQ